MMDAVPDMDDLLDQLEASEETSQSSTSDRPLTKLNNENVVNGANKGGTVFAISSPSRGFGVPPDKLCSRETTSADYGLQFPHLKDLSNISESTLVQEAKFGDTQLMKSLTKGDGNITEGTKDEVIEAGSNSNESHLDVNGSGEVSNEAKANACDNRSSQTTSSQLNTRDCIVERRAASEEANRSGLHLTTNVCDLAEADHSAQMAKERITDKFMQISLQRFNKEDTSFERTCRQASKELDQMARQFEEMDRYLARCAAENPQLKDSEVTTEGEGEEVRLPNVESTPIVSGSSVAANSSVSTAREVVNLEPTENVRGTANPSRVRDVIDSAQFVPKDGAIRLQMDYSENEAVTIEDNGTDEEEESMKVSQLSGDSETTKRSGDVVHDERNTVITDEGTSSVSGSFISREETAVCEEMREGTDEKVVKQLAHATEDVPKDGTPDQFAEGNETAIGNELPENIDGEVGSIVAGTSKEEAKQNEEEKEEEGEEAHEEVGMEEEADETRTEETDIEEHVEETRGVSVVASTHDISSETDLTRLTESELQLGKVKPVWIADSETASCMLCCTKFTIIIRRHHCRSCGRVLCGQCTAHKATLPYMNDASKKFKVCEPCFQTLQRIADYEKTMNSEEGSADVTANEARTSLSVASTDMPRVTKSVLKVKSSEVSEEVTEGNERASSSGEVAKRSVTFRDGVNPGEGGADRDTAGMANAPEPSSLIPKLKKKRASVVRRVKELRMEEENVCLLPNGPNDPLYTRTLNGVVEKFENMERVEQCLADGEVVIVAVSRNLWCNIKICNLECCGVGRVMCVSSCGMSVIGLDEIMIIYDLDEDESTSLPIDIIRRVREIYECSLKPQNESFDEKMGIRAAHLRVPSLHCTLRKSELNDFAGRDILLFRPSLQCFDNLIVPSSPFLVACFVYQCETLWALAIPNRLLYRIGLQASYYPTPIVNRRSREPVYTSVSDTTVLKVFTDFRNWSYRMLMVHGSTLELQDDESLLVIPSWAKSELKNLVESNKNMIAFALDFNASADSHLVCEQDEAGTYRTQVFTTGVTARKVTGASFIIVDGALKSGDVPLSVSVVEDGIAIRLRADAMIAFAEALSAGEDYTLQSSTMKFSLEWRNVPLRTGSIGQLVSPVDQSSLMGNYEYGLTESRILSSLYSIPSVNEWALRLVAVYNMAKGKFAPLIQSKVFAVSEQIAAQIAYTLVPFIDALISNNIREIFIRIRVTSDDAAYTAAEWAKMEQEHSTWKDLLDNQLVPGLFNICSFIPSGFEAELAMALVSTRPLP